MPVRAVILVDNRAREGLERAWGLSVLVEAPGGRVLFDAGPDPEVLCSNADSLGVDLSAVEAVVVSHPHRDHYGGLPCVAKHAPGVTVYLPPSPSNLVAWIRRMGLAPVAVKPRISVAPGATASEAIHAAIGLWERSLAVETGKGPLVLLGCSHPGPSRLVEAALRAVGAEKAWLVMGGLHAAPEEEVDRVMGVSELLAPLHCSGPAGDYARARYPGRVLDLAAGDTVEA